MLLLLLLRQPVYTVCGLAILQLSHRCPWLPQAARLQLLLLPLL